MDDFRNDVVDCLKQGGFEFKEPEWYRVGTGWANGKCVGQIGAFESLDNAKKNCPEGYKVFESDGDIVFEVKESGELTARKLNGLTEVQKIARIAPLYQQCQRDTGMLASVGLAQFCLESGYGTTDLAQYANNLHGMKASLSGNTWAGSVWDGRSKYNKKTEEQDASGRSYYIYADFRRYPSCKESIYDRAAYFIGAIRSGTTKRYPNVNLITNAVEQVRLLKAGGYATDVNYVSKLTNIINKYNLTQYDVTNEVDYKAIAKKYQQTQPTPTPTGKTYTVQAGVFDSEENAKNIVKIIIEECKVDARYVKEADGFHVYCGTFSVKAYADRIVDILNKHNIENTVK
jgi:hypothetical protein